MLTAVADYIQNVWHSTLPTRLLHSFFIAAVFEALIVLTKWRLRLWLGKRLARDLHRDAQTRVIRRRVVLGLPSAIVQYALMGVALLMILRYLGFDIRSELMPALGVSIVAALVVFRDVLVDAAAGYFILFDDLISIGDAISVGETNGEVVDITLRTTRLLTPDGREVTLANRMLLRVTNHSRAVPPER